MSRKKLTTLFGSFLWTFRTVHRLYTYKTTGSLTKTIISIIYRTEFLFEYFIQFCFVLQFSISFSVPPICVIFPHCVFVSVEKVEMVIRLRLLIRLVSHHFLISLTFENCLLGSISWFVL